MKLVLGSAQFGMNYGVNNRRGKPPLAECLLMLKKAWDSKIRIFDTAWAYGDAEDVLGAFIKENGLQRDIRIVSKLRPNLIDEKTPDPVGEVKRQVHISLDRLGIAQLDGYLLHTPANFYNPSVIEGLRQCRAEGLIHHFGVSIYELEDAINVVRSGTVDYIQVPFSVFDQRVLCSDFFKIAQDNGVVVFGRSVFVQGLIMMDNVEVPAHLSEAVPYIDRFDQIISRYGLQRAQAALGFMLAHTEIDYAVIGVDDLEQLDFNIGIAEAEPIPQACIDELIESYKNVSKAIIFPSLWSNRSP
jgi:aryl-alcohol dehydrogenase-like predicted oxidoreductase